jgi:hypothetical protein
MSSGIHFGIIKKERQGEWHKPVSEVNRSVGLNLQSIWARGARRRGARRPAVGAGRAAACRAQGLKDCVQVLRRFRANWDVECLKPRHLHVCYHINIPKKLTKYTQKK